MIKKILIALRTSHMQKDKTVAMAQSQNGNSVTARYSPVNVGRLRASSQLLYELTCGRVENSNKGPLRTQSAQANQRQKQKRNGATTVPTFNTDSFMSYGRGTAYFLRRGSYPRALQI